MKTTKLFIPLPSSDTESLWQYLPFDTDLSDRDIARIQAIAKCHIDNLDIEKAKFTLLALNDELRYRDKSAIANRIRKTIDTPTV